MDASALAAWGRAAVGPLAVAVAYVLGSQLGFVLRFPPAATSILWPPNAILTAALLLSPPRRWWTFLLAAFPAHLAVQMHLGWPTGLILALFVTNCLEAVIGAGLVRHFSDAPERFDTLRRAALFVGAVVLVAVVISGFVDATAVAVWRGEPYWHVWRTRLFSNMLTALALVPVIVALARLPLLSRVGQLSRRTVEAALLFFLLIVVGAVIFTRPFMRSGVSLPEQSELVLLLPVLLWAAARFGAAGSSFAILTTAVIAFVGATAGRDSPTAVEAAQAVRGLQAFLLVSGIPLFGLGALMDERRSIERVLEERLRFEALLSRTSGAFVHLPSNAMGAEFETQLRHVGEYSDVASVMLFRLSEGEPPLEVVSSWSASGSATAPRLAGWSPSEVLERAVRHEPFWLEDAGEGWIIGIPLEAGARLLGAIVFVGKPADARGHDDRVLRLKLIADVFASALARKESEDALRAGEEMKSAILASLSSQVAVLDRGGRIIVANRTWPAEAATAGAQEEAGWGAVAPSLLANEAAEEGMRAVLDGTRPSFTLEYPGPTDDRWFLLTVVPLRRPDGGAVVARVDVTERRRAEDEARRSRDELAHFLRVSTVGELTTSLAHELNQPLAAILANAQAARTMLAKGDGRELMEILSDIVEEDKRAGEVIRRLRDLLRKGVPAHAPLDLNLLAKEVVRLVGSDATLRDVSIRLDLAPQGATVVGDRIQIQQVMLNLLLNAMDAMADCPADGRQMVVSTAVSADRVVHFAVSDTGTGLREDEVGRIFEPFYTTKLAGMGMGLSIARSIVAAHGGRIWACANAGAGATLQFTLPPPPSGPP